MNAPNSVEARRNEPGHGRALSAFDTELARLDLLIEREVLRLRARYELSLDEFRGLYVSDRQVDELIRARPHSTQAATSEQLTAEAAARLEALEAGALADDTPWSQLALRLRLNRPERDLLLLGLAPEIDPKYETLIAYLNNDVTRKWPTPELAMRLFAATAEERVDLSGRLMSEAPLMANGILEAAPVSRDLPRGQRGYRVAPPVAGWLLGLPYSDERLSEAAHLLALIPVVDWLPAATRALAERAAQWIEAGGPTPIFGCTAPEPLDAAIAAQQIFAFTGQPVLLLDLHALRSSPAQELLPAVRCLCAVFRTGVIAGPLDALFDHDGRPVESAATLRRLLPSVPTLVLTGSPPAFRRALHEFEALRQRAFELRLPELSAAERGAVWRSAIGGRRDAADVEGLADRFILGAGRIVRAVQIAGHVAAFNREAAAAPERFFDAARAVSAEGSDAAVRTVDTLFTWDDLVVPALVRSRLQDVLRAIELRPRVLDQWGFARRMSGARGVKVMFAGASGTGKTMAAAILAKSLKLELHRIELAGVISKYIGETEKNLDRAFNAARSANAILFIDEADALLGKRSEVKDAHDRYANVEIAYLLQKMEDHDGVVILATNLANNIDEAFSRRMHFVVEFPVPDVASREKLWRGMFPADAPLAGDVDFVFLARQFVLAGGDIRNVALDAAYHAAQAGRSIGMGHILRAIAQQYAKRGTVPTAAEFREHFGLLSQADA